MAALLLSGAGVVWACGGGGDLEREPPRALPPVATAPKPPPIPPSVGTDAGADAAVDSPPPSPSRREKLTRFPTPTFGPGDVAPGAPHPFRLAVSTRAMRANASGAKIGQTLSLLPALVDAKRRTGVDPFSEGDWLLAYGRSIGAFVVNATVVRHHEKDEKVTEALGQAGFESSQYAPGGLASDLYGTDTVLLRPRAQTLAFVPQDRAKDLAAALVKLDDPGLRPGEISRVVILDPAAMLSRYVPPEIKNGEAVVKPASDGGLDVTGEGSCASADACKAAAKNAEETIARQNTFVVRLVTHGILNGVVVRADGSKVKATMHVTPDQIDAIDQMLRAVLGLPARDPVAPP